MEDTRRRQNAARILGSWEMLAYYSKHFREVGRESELHVGCMGY